MKLLKTENKSAYLRKMALDGYIINVDYTDIKENTAQLVMRHQAEMSMGAIAEYLNSDHCTVVYQVMEDNKLLLSKMGFAKNTYLPEMGGKPFWKAVLEMS